MPKAYEPSSPGLPPAARINTHKDRDAHRRKHPAKRGRMTLQDAEMVISTVMAEMDDKTPRDIAIATERDVETIKKTIKSARATLQSRAEHYVDIHHTAAMIAASQGDAKPAQWALERIAESGERVVDAPATEKTMQLPQPAINILIGGVPRPTHALPPRASVIDVPTLTE